jgi:hypothetical protein
MKWNCIWLQAFLRIFLNWLLSNKVLTDLRELRLQKSTSVVLWTRALLLFILREAPAWRTNKQTNTDAGCLHSSNLPQSSRAKLSADISQALMQSAPHSTQVYVRRTDCNIPLKAMAGKESTYSFPAEAAEVIMRFTLRMWSKWQVRGRKRRKKMKAH